jgi:hypothetical protein
LYSLKPLLDVGVYNNEKITEPSASHKGPFVSKCSQVFENSLLLDLFIDITLNLVISDIDKA